tara:strand:+ start:22875 stop:24482 length:1608 start_codon:yes stop_codon:yes gene_type:complete
MPQNVATEMLLVTSDDYWGHAGDFDSAVNFYPYSFIVTPDQYSGMDDADKSRFYPCALFYYMGETDNHGYRPQRIGTRVEDDGVVGMGRVLGLDRLANQEIRTYIRGERTGYSIPGSYTMLNGVGESYEAISTAAESGELSPGTFGVGDLLYNQDEVISTINTTAGIETEESSAENYAAEEATPSSYNDVNPEDYVATPEATPEGYEVADASADVENYFEAEGYNFNHTTGDFTQDSAAGSGYGVPEYYGSNSKGPMVMEAEVIYGTDGSVLGQAVGNWDSTPMGYQAEGSGDISHDRIDEEEDMPVIMRYDHPFTFYDWDIDGEVSEEQEDEITDGIHEELGNEPGRGEHDFDVDIEDGREAYVQTHTDYGEGRFYDLGAEGLSTGVGMPAIDDGFYPNSYGEDSSTFGQGVPQWYGSAEGLGDYTGPLTDGFGENSASVSNQGVPVWYGSAETEEAYNGMGENSASISGQGVPQWYGSAETMKAQELGQVESNRYTKMALLVAGVVSGFLVAKRISDSASEEPEEPEESESTE